MLLTPPDRNPAVGRSDEADVTHSLRADARRNRARILDTARAQIIEHGPNVGMSEIANAAGLAVGTLYRHFPTKTDLVEAVITEQIERLVDAAEAAWSRVETGSAASEELFVFVRGVIEAAADNRALKVAAQALGTEFACPPAAARGTVALRKIIAAGQDTGSVREDLTVTDLYLLVATGPLDHPKQTRERWLELIRPGLLP
ncbi:MAG: helix-turn-helix transcriptional regulator [Coriobacteriia bacterium]|nr:helix-turn-helix transcriptional regulator [Coriobacteriia bacterium]MBN2840277.1 helix-turn-helix transcriptional regulator [Coriobacteriia bacterium]